jgi:phenylacetate-CoA ligase
MEDFTSHQRLSVPRVAQLQSDNLRAFMTYAGDHCPYYRAKFAACGINCAADDIRGELAKFPPLTKDEIRANLDAMISDEFNDAKGLTVKATGGSTGVPLKIYGDSEDYRINNMTISRQRRWVGWTGGEETLTLFGGFRDWHSRFKLFLKTCLLNDTTVNIMDSSALDYDRILRRVYRRAPEIIIGYFGVLKQLAEHAAALSRPVQGVKLIVACAEPIDERGRELVQQWLGAKVYSQYGCREVGAMGQECKEQKGYHYAQDTSLFEVLDDEGRLADYGNLTVTYFPNKVVPLIRYMTGDAGSLDLSPCPCGLPFARIRSIDGRVSSNIVLRDGRKVTTIILPHVLKDYPWIREFQAEQSVVDKLTIRVRRDDSCFSEESLNRVSKTLRDLLGPEIEIDWQFNVPFVQVLTGKHVSFLSNLK